MGEQAEQQVGGRAAVPPSPAMNSCRLISSIGFLRTELSKLGRALSPSVLGSKDTTPRGRQDRLLHCGISAPSADGFMAEMGHQQKHSPRGFFVRFPRERTLPPSLTHAHPTPPGTPPWPRRGYRPRRRSGGRRRARAEGLACGAARNSISPRFFRYRTWQRSF